MAFIAGAYTVTFGGADVGQIEDGIELEFTFTSEEIRGDDYGDTPQDGVYRGGTCFLNMTLLEYNATGALGAFWPAHATTFGIVSDATYPVGRTHVGSSMYGALALTSTAGTPAASSPATLTANRAILAPNFPVRMLFAPRLRRIPLRFICYPDANSKFFVIT